MTTVDSNNPSLIAIAKQANASWDAAFNAKDAQQLGSMYDTAAVVMPAGAPVVNGPAAIAEFFGNVIGLGFIEHAISHVALQSSGSLAVQQATWSAASLEADGSKKQYGGSLQLVLAKQADNSWKVLSQIWN